MKTTIYLDVDGVLNAVSKRSPSLAVTGWEVDQWDTEPVNGWQILYSRELIRELNELAARNDVEFKWLTTWEDDATEVLSPAIGIQGQDWAVLHGDQHSWHGREWWKLQAIISDVEDADGQFIWIDDDISAEPEAVKWVNEHPAGMYISPNTTHGLTSRHLTNIQDFINAGREAAA